MSTASEFTGSIPDIYHACLGPLLFEPYAADLVARVRRCLLSYSSAPAGAPGPRVLELACGTGIVTKHLLAALPPGGTLVATDLNTAMLDVARRYVGAGAPANAGADGAKGRAEGAARLTFQQADACKLPFPDGSFDLIVAQFGVMFFPDKVAAMREARRVLAKAVPNDAYDRGQARESGRYLFNVWDSLDHNPIPATVQATLESLLPANPPRFLAQTPYGWHDRATIESTVRAGGFATVTLEAVTFPSQSPSAADAARGLIDGTPNLVALSERGITDTAPIRAAASQRLAERLGDSPCRSIMRAVVVEAS
ncbi:MAG: class I SAM-dependent methyltransferase [Phycisphaerales bacterium]